jgi:iron complex transport system substrate-binding protein
MQMPVNLRRLTAALVLSAAVGLAAGCGDDGSGGSDQPAASGGAGFPRTVEHAMGSTTIKSRPERVVVLDTAEAGAATLVGVKPVAAVSVDPVNQTYPAHLRTELDGVPDVGPLDEPNLDRILSLKPDLIISSKVRHEKIYDRLSQIAPTVFSASPGAAWQDNILLFATAMGREQQAQAALTEYRDRARALGEAIKTKNGGTMPTFSIVRFVDGPTRLYQPASFSGVVLADAGLARPAAQQDPTNLIAEIGPELIDRANADYVFVCTYGDPDKTQQKAFQASPLWNQLPAVKNQRVFPVSDDTWMTGIGVQGAQLILDDIAKAAGVDAPR